jgi:hypothetical protein
MKKFDLTNPILTLEGKPVNDEKEKPLTYAKALGAASINALESDTPEQKYSDFSLAVKITKTPEAIAFSSEEITRLKTKVGKFYGPLVVGRVWDLLEQKK